MPIRLALATIEEAARSLGPENTITLSVTPSLAAKWLVPCLVRFAAAHPAIDLQIAATEALADFRADAVDLAPLGSCDRANRGADNMKV